MMWLLFAFVSAALLGFYDVFKKKSLQNNAVIPVLFLNTVFCSLLFLPLIAASGCGILVHENPFYIPSPVWEEQQYILLKACIVLGSWTFGYFSMKHLPLTTIGPINATRPVMVLIGALIIFSERLNACQWIGVALAIVSFFMLSRSSKKEGIDFGHNKWIYFAVTAALLGAMSALYDKYLMASPTNGGLGLNRMAVQGYYNFYQCALMSGVMLICRAPKHLRANAFRWDWCIILISVFLTAADFVYFYALSLDGALVSVVSMVRRASVIVSFLCGALVFHEKNLRSKAVDLALVLLGMLFLYFGTD